MQPSCNLLEFGHEYKPKVQNTEPFSTAMGFTMLLAGHVVKVLSNFPKKILNPEILRDPKFQILEKNKRLVCNKTDQVGKILKNK